MNNIALIKSTPLGQAFILALGETKKAIKYLMTLTFPINFDIVNSSIFVNVFNNSFAIKLIRS